jgi:hypothetical protein
MQGAISNFRRLTYTVSELRTVYGNLLRLLYEAWTEVPRHQGNKIQGARKRGGVEKLRDLSILPIPSPLLTFT